MFYLSQSSDQTHAKPAGPYFGLSERNLFLQLIIVGYPSKLSTLVNKGQISLNLARRGLKSLWRVGPSLK